jgi:hypothetical protein
MKKLLILFMILAKITHAMNKDSTQLSISPDFEHTLLSRYIAALLQNQKSAPVPVNKTSKKSEEMPQKAYPYLQRGRLPIR